MNRGNLFIPQRCTSADKLMCIYIIIHLNVIIFHSGKGSRFSFLTKSVTTLELPSC